MKPTALIPLLVDQNPGCLVVDGQKKGPGDGDNPAQRNRVSNSLLSVVAVAAVGWIVADVHPAVIGHPLDAEFAVAVTAVVRPCRGGQ